MIEFEECANYRGELQAKEESGRFYWRVRCDMDEEEWREMPGYLWNALKRHHESRVD